MKLKKSICAATVFVMIAAILPTVSYAAEKNEVYTNSEYVGVSDGTKSKPYANFEDAVKNVSHGGTVYISGKGFINTQDEHGVIPYVINKNITVTTQEPSASLTVRAGGIILGADVKMENIELNFANKYRNGIFLNGNTFEANNVTHGSGSRDVHLVCGAVYNTATGKLESPEPGKDARLVITGNSEFGNIYAGSLNGSFDGNADIEITAGAKMTLGGSIYSSGAIETEITTDDWFDINGEPDPPTANKAYTVSGRVNVTMNKIRATYIDGAAANGGTALTLSTEYPYDGLALENISSLTITGGTIEPKTLTASQNGIDITVKNGAKLELNNVSNPIISNFNGGGTIVVANTDMLTITGAVTGTTAFETAGGFGGVSGIALAGHTYITAPKSQADSFTFAPFSGQSGLTLEKDENGLWTTSELSTEPTLAESFAVADKFTTATLRTVNEDMGVDIPVNWTANIDGAWLSEIPINYTVEYEGGKYIADVMYDEETSTYGAMIPDLHMDITSYSPDSLTIAIATMTDNIQPMKSGVYRITASTVSKDGKNLSDSFTVVVVDENAQSKTGAFVAITDNTGNSVKDITAGSFAAKTVIPNTTEKSTVILAKYIDNELKEIKLSDIKSNADADFAIKQTQAIPVSESEISAGVQLKAFVFESFETITPLCKAEEI